jgi:hypothetical protein
MSNAQIYRNEIKNFFSLCKHQKQKTFKSGELIKFIKRNSDIKMFYPDSALRQLRKLREKNELNYSVACKAKMIYKIEKLKKV